MIEMMREALAANGRVCTRNFFLLPFQSLNFQALKHSRSYASTRGYVHSRLHPI